MSLLNRRTVVQQGLAAMTVGAGTCGRNALGGEPQDPKHWTLEGQLQIHPKFLYRYYLVLLDGQKCALYGTDHRPDPPALSEIPPPTQVRLRGVLGTEHHPGSTPDNASPFPQGWWVYMDVHQVEVLK